MATGHTATTDPLAYVLLGARMFQLLVHLASNAPLVVNMRFGAFAVQLGIGVYWAFGLLEALFHA